MSPRCCVVSATRTLAVFAGYLGALLSTILAVGQAAWLAASERQISLLLKGCLLLSSQLNQELPFKLAQKIHTTSSDLQ